MCSAQDVSDGFQKKKFGWGVCGWVALYMFATLATGFILEFLQSPLLLSSCRVAVQHDRSEAGVSHQVYGHERGPGTVAV